VVNNAHATHVKEVSLLLDSYGATYAEQAGIRLKDSPAPLFQLLILALMLSARIASDKAVSATRSLFDAGFTTAKKMADATWQQRVDAITWSGYKRYDERTATFLGEAAQRVHDQYNGDLRQLHSAAHNDVESLKELLKEFKGVGTAGADIFLREVQAVWPDVYPYADDRVLSIAAALDLPDSVDNLSQLCSQQDFARLTAALMQVKLKREQEDFLNRLKQASG
jgi:endonuclease III